MSTPDLSAFSIVDLQSPNLDATTLAQLAQHRPDLRAAVRAHPGCYPQLAAWIDSQPAPRQPDPSLQQIADGAKNVAAGAKEFFTAHVAPAAAGAARHVHNTIGTEIGAAKSSGSWQSWLPLALPALAVLGFIALVLPAATVSAIAFDASYSESATFFDGGAGGTGVLFVILLLIVFVAGVLAVIIKNPATQLTAIGSSGFVGLVVIVLCLGTLSSIGSVNAQGSGFGAQATVGPGLVILLLTGIALLAAAVLLFVTWWHARRAGTPTSQAPQPPQPPEALPMPPAV